MHPEEFVRTYEQALATQDLRNLEPLVYSDACVTFSNGTIHKGKLKVRRGFEKNFSLIKGEDYSITNARWVTKGPETAIYLFDFSWTVYINGRQVSGAGFDSQSRLTDVVWVNCI